MSTTLSEVIVMERAEFGEKFFRSGLLLNRYSFAFLLVSVLDFCFTYCLLTHDRLICTEMNPFAQYCLVSGGFLGMALFKLTLVMIVETACYLIALQQPVKGRRVLNLCTTIVGLVVLYSFSLMYSSGG